MMHIDVINSSLVNPAFLVTLITFSYFDSLLVGAILRNIEIVSFCGFTRAETLFACLIRIAFCKDGITFAHNTLS